MNTTSFKISGMTCASCARLNEKAISKLTGVKSANVNIANNKAYVEYDENLVPVQKIKDAVKDIGYGVEEEGHADMDEHAHHGTVQEKEISVAKKRFIGSLIFTLPLFVMMFKPDLMIGIDFLGVDLLLYIFALLTAVVVLVFGWHFHKSAAKKLKHFMFNMDSLISMGTLTAFIYSVWAMFNNQHVYFEASAAITTLINLGKWMEALSKGKAKKALEKLMEMSVKKARIIKGNKEFEIPIEEVKIGDILHVKAGEKIPIDSIIVEGSASINESMLTGESMPVLKKEGDELFGATINQDGNIKIKVTKIGKDTILSQIIKMVEEAQGAKAPIQKLADKISGVFVPIVILIALTTFGIWFIVTGDFTQSLLPAVAVLVIACPCALGLATPTAIMIGTSTGARLGILIKNGESLEKSNDIDVVIFDKTGTLTEGKPKVADIIPFGITKKELLNLAGGLAEMSDHILSKAITSIAKEDEGHLEIFSKFKEISGHGIEGKNKESGKDYYLGNIKLMDEKNVKIEKEVKEIFEKLSEEGKTPILIADNKKVIGVFGLMDTPREDSAQIIESLKKSGISTVMITGDNKKTAAYISKMLGMENFIAEVLPQDKANEIKKIQKNGKKVAFVGDGINDAPALVQADLGIAMGTGTDIAIESGNIVLMKGSPKKVLTAIKLSQHTFRVIKENLFWAFIYNIIGIPVAALGLLNPIIASAAMSFSSVSVILNSLRIRRFK